MELVNIYSVLCSHVILHTEHAHYFVSQSGAVCFCSVLLGDKAYFFYFSGKTYRQTVPSNASLGCQYTWASLVPYSTSQFLHWMA